MSREDDEDSRPPIGTSPPAPQRTLAPHLILIGGVMGALLASALLLAVAAAGRIASRHPTGPSATTAPATVTPSPSPTPQLGYTVYTDAGDGFLVQYPKTWSVDSTAPPVIQFSDNSNETGYVLQVALPASAALPNAGGDPALATTWVNYEMNIFAQKYPQNFILLDSGVSTREIGGVLWQSGAGLITNNSSGIRLQVYATVYQGKPYLINLLAAQDRFDAGELDFFDPMLSSFSFMAAPP